MSNADMPSMAIPPVQFTDVDGSRLVATGTNGLTKREQACLTMGVADTGDAELDAIIARGNELKLAGMAMQGLLVNMGRNGFNNPNQVAEATVKSLDALLKELEQDNE